MILITGSGAQDRDESLLGHKPFFVLADNLTRQGLAVLRVDDRGVGGSTGSSKTSTSEDFAGDVLAGLALLKRRKEIDGKKLGLIGHSEGGIIAPIVAARSRDVSFIVLMAGTGVPGSEILVAQAQLILQAAGSSESQRKFERDIQKRLIDIITGESRMRRLDPLQKLAAALKEIRAAICRMRNGRPWPITRERLLEAAVDAFNNGLVPLLPRRQTTRGRLCGRVRVPRTGDFNGERDLQVPAKENLAEIQKALAGGQQPRRSRRSSFRD